MIINTFTEFEVDKGTISLKVLRDSGGVYWVTIPINSIEYLIDDYENNSFGVSLLSGTQFICPDGYAESDHFLLPLNDIISKYKY